LAYLPQYQDATLAPTTPGATSVSSDQMRAFKGYAGITQNVSRGWVTHHSLQLSLQRRFRNGVSFGANDTIGLSTVGSTAARLQHNPDGTVTNRPDQETADDLLQVDPIRHTIKANMVWDLPDLQGDSKTERALGYILNDWQLSSVWTATTGAPYAAGFSYQNGGGSVNLTGSPDYGARVRVNGDTGSGCNSADALRQFNAAAFQGPLVGSVGLESGNNYVKGCFQSALDLSFARNIRLPKGRTIQLRADMFNAPNQAIITNRNTTMNLTSPSDPNTITNLPYDANGNPIASRSLPRGAGFGVATGYQNPRTVQLQIRFTF
jgi:hypothetical protein